MTDEAFDPATGEVIESVPAADGGRRYPAAHSLADFFRMLEDGQFDADVTFELAQLAEEMESVAEAQGGHLKVKGKITVSVDIVREPDGLYMLTPSFAVKRPTEARKRSVAWLTPDNRFTPNKPDQGHLFGTIRDVTPRRAIKN